MGIPTLTEANKNKELLLEIDSIEPDTKGHHLADISLSSNDSLSRSRRRWRLVKIISKVNANFQGRSKKLIFYQSLSALLSIILTAILIYWLVNLKSVSTSSEASSSTSSSSIVSSRSHKSPEPLSLSRSPLRAHVTKPALQHVPMNHGWSENFDSSDYNPLEIPDNNSMIKLPTLNGTNAESGNAKMSNSVNDSDDNRSDNNFLSNFPPLRPFPLFQSFPRGWFEAGRPRFLPPFLPPPPPFQIISSFDSEESPTIEGPFIQPIQQLQPPSSADFPNLAGIRSSAKDFHSKAIGAVGDMIKKIKDSKMFDNLMPGSDFEPELIIRSDDDDEWDRDQQDDESLEDSNEPEDTVDHVFNFIKKVIF